MSEVQEGLVAGLEPEEEVTDVVCDESDLKDGDAISNQCTHYGAPLSKGVLSGHRVRCPWHGSCFNVKTGDLEEYPGIDCLPCHKACESRKQQSLCVCKEKGKIQGQPKRIKWMGARDQAVSHTVMLLGGGAASLMCAETLRQENYGGRIIMVSRDDLLPYDKTRLSKIMNAESDSLLMRRMEFFHKYDIEVWLKKEALSIDTNKKTVAFDDGLIQGYDQILIATGCRAKNLDCPGVDLENVLMLETPEDARCIHYACMGCRTVVVGTSFVGMEVAAYMIDMASSITIIGSSELPYQKTLGPEIGKVTMMVKAVKLRSGITIQADLLIVGIGVNPNSEFLKGSPVRMDSKNYVIVDKYMRTNITDVYCAGDLTSFPLKMAKGQNVSIGHWQVAQAHGRIAALSMLHREVELNIVPFYWTVLLGRTIRYAGCGEGYTKMVLKGKFENMKFLALYLKDEEVVAAAGLNVEPAVSVVAERLAQGRVITQAEAE
ncbi:Apoptosis-inducing factor 3 [Labeo rohita]|uniref:Apoptosis-inducing factor 3 n=1 Tax=Labeo rohita TaxID=84645 RepID=A0ABQ8LK82_LABRO|nr:Apoptosis-inducing factor 3 [Labeo rohita]